MATVDYCGVGKVFPGGTRALGNLDIHLDDGDFLVLVGASGCGKSTALRILAGLETLSEGKLLINDRSVAHLSPQARNIAMVFQSYALYPHMSVRDNLRFPLQMRKISRSEADQLIDHTARMLDLQDLLERRPGQLSGGQRQRVAMGRALVRQPDCFLMDEPLSNLDAKLRVQMRGEITQLQRRTGITTVYVTHDQVEAMTMGSRVGVMQGGRLRQCAPPEELYRQPADIYVAGFIGSPSMNLFRAPVTHSEGQAYLVIGDQRLRLPNNDVAEGTYSWGLRPEHITAPDQVPADQRLRVTPDEVEALGHERIAYLPVPVPALDAEASMNQQRPIALGESESRWSARLPGDFPVARGAGIDLGIAVDKFYRFHDNGLSVD